MHIFKYLQWKDNLEELFKFLSSFSVPSLARVTLTCNVLASTLTILFLLQ